MRLYERCLYGDVVDVLFSWHKYNPSPPLLIITYSGQRLGVSLKQADACERDAQTLLGKRCVDGRALMRPPGMSPREQGEKGRLRAARYQLQSRTESPQCPVLTVASL